MEIEKEVETEELPPDYRVTEDQVEYMYTQNREYLKSKYELMDEVDHNYKYKLLCSKCNKPTQHTRAGLVYSTLSWKFEDDVYESADYRKQYQCNICGTFRIYGLLEEK